MAGESHLGMEAPDPSRGNGKRSRLKTALMILFWFGVLCAGLMSLVGVLIYREVQDYQAKRDRQEQLENSLRPVPSAPIDIFIDPASSDPSESPAVSENTTRVAANDTMPANNEAAPPEAELTGPLETARQAAGIVINEIHFHPASDWDNPEDTRQEFIELHNAGTAAVPLEGYKLKKAVKFTFPPSTLKAGGYLVIASDPDRFLSVNQGIANVLGGWEGQLSNSGEEIELVDAEGKKVDSVRYSDEGDWATRTAGNSRNYNNGGLIFSSRRSTSSYRSGGWEWQNPADGKGNTLELASAAVTNQCGQNWRPSAERGGTPGKVNSRYSPDIAPVIRNVKHSPVIPTPKDTITVSTEIRDELNSGFTVELFWRVSDNRAVASFNTTAMTEAGGSFTATVPAQSAGTVIEFFVRATDGTYSRTWPGATDLGQAANAHFQVEAQADEPAPGFALYRLVMTQQDKQKFDRMSRHTDAQVNATLIADDGAGPIIRYNCGVRYRGAGSRGHYPTPMRVNIPSDTPWHEFTRMNLNSKFSWLQFIGMKIFEDAGERAPNVKPVAVRTNGVDLMTTYRGRQNGFSNTSRTPAIASGTKPRGSGSQSDYGYYVHAEPLGREWVDKHYCADSGGNAYKKVRPDRDWAYRSGNVRRYMSDGWSKISNSAAADWSDLDQFLRVMNNAPGDRDYLDQVERVADLQQWYRWLGINAILANGEGGIAKGIDDDYGLYRGVEDTRFKFLPHDLDTILARGDSSVITNAYHTLFDFAEYREEIDPLEALFDEDAVRSQYLAHIRNLIDTTFASGDFEAFLQNHAGAWVPDHELRRMSSWMNSRRAYALSEIEQVLGKSTGPQPQPKSQASFDANVPSGLCLNEVMAAADSDYIELFNASDTSIDAAGLRLTDKKSKPDKYVIPDGTIIAPGGYLVVGAEALGFKLEASGETAYLFGTEGDAPLDSITFGLQVEEFSVGRVGADHSRWTLNQPTPGSPNKAQEAGDPSSLSLNEWLVHPHLKFDTDFVEVYNKSDQVVALGGVRITDDPYNYPERYELPPLSFIGGKCFVMFKATGPDAVKSDARQLPMKFAYEYGYIHLAGSGGTRIDQVSYHCHRKDISQGRSEDGGPHYTYYPNPTPGTSNTGPPQEFASDSKTIIDGLRISEIMFHPIGIDALEFIELTNAGSAAIDLKGVRFTQGIDFEFDDEFELAPGACAVIASDAVEFAAEYGDDIPVVGEFKGKLSNKGELIQLKLPKPSERLIVSIDFDDKWYPDADGLGKSLVLTDPKLSREACAEKNAWKASAKDKGSPGKLE